LFTDTVRYEVCFALLIPIFLIYYLIEKFRGTFVKYKISSFLVSYLFISLVFVFMIFPFVHMRGFSMGHTYLNPFQRIADELSVMSYTGGIRSFILYNVRYFGSSFVIYFLAGFSAAIMFKKKKAFVVICGTSLALQLWYVVWGLAVGGGIDAYKSVSTETVILFIAFGVVGVLLYGIIVSFSEKHLEDSAILNWLYHVFTIYKNDIKEDENIGGGTSFGIHSNE
jgi:hypothetical protein